MDYQKKEAWKLAKHLDGIADILRQMIGEEKEYEAQCEARKKWDEAYKSDIRLRIMEDAKAYVENASEALEGLEGLE